nr:hypothetical protein I308_06472 [Cryptococcus tetragattii IND107]
MRIIKTAHMVGNRSSSLLGACKRIKVMDLPITFQKTVYHLPMISLNPYVAITPLSPISRRQLLPSSSHYPLFFSRPRHHPSLRSSLLPLRHITPPSPLLPRLIHLRIVIPLLPSL